jgi:hypothetical protein
MDKLKRLKIRAAGYSATEIAIYDLENRLENELTRFMCQRDYKAIFNRKTNPGHQGCVLTDKWAMHFLLSNLGFPVPVVHGLYHPRFGMTVTGAPFTNAAEVGAVLARAGTRRIFVKPRGGRQGMAAAAFALSGGAEDLLCDDGRGGSGPVPLADVLASLPAESPREYRSAFFGWMVQDYLQQHETLAALNPDALNTVRLVTWCDTAGTIAPLTAILRLGRAGSQLDGWGRGGLSVAIDLATGTLGEGIFKQKYGGARTDRHPGTGARFTGVTLPDWHAAVALCTRAAGMLPGVRSIGWDLAFTPAGPVIVEGNTNWDLSMVQVHTDGLLTEELRADLARIGATFPDRLPGLPATVLRLGRRAAGRLREKLAPPTPAR